MILNYMQESIAWCSQSWFPFHEIQMLFLLQNPCLQTDLYACLMTQFITYWWLLENTAKELRDNVIKIWVHANTTLETAITQSEYPLETSGNTFSNGAQLLGRNPNNSTKRSREKWTTHFRAAFRILQFFWYKTCTNTFLHWKLP